MQDIARHHSGWWKAGGLCSHQQLLLIVSHLLSHQALFSSPASAAAVCFGFSSSSFPRHPPGHPFFQLVPLVLENFLQFLHLLWQRALPWPPAEPLMCLFQLFFIFGLVFGDPCAQERWGKGWRSPVHKQSALLLPGG